MSLMRSGLHDSKGDDDDGALPIHAGDTAPINRSSAVSTYRWAEQDRLFGRKPRVTVMIGPGSIHVFDPSKVTYSAQFGEAVITT